MVSIRVGFTGTQLGMTGNQMLQFARWIQQIQPIAFHHGDCEGADAQAHDMVWDLRDQGRLSCLIVVHPPEDPKKRAFKGLGSGLIEVRAELPYLARNRLIVKETDILVAAPRSLMPRTRSGTWTTIRYAHSLGKTVKMLNP